MQLMRLLIICLSGCALSGLSFAAAGNSNSRKLQATGDGVVRVVAVGSNSSYKPDLAKLRYAEADAVRFSAAMKSVGLVPQLHAQTVVGVTVKEFRDALNELYQEMQRAQTLSTKLVFYFSGHADTQGLHFRDGLISRTELHEMLARIKARTKIALIDACFSESITTKGIERTQAFELPRAEFDEPSGTVFLTAASEKQFAFESSELKGSVFTHHVLTGLYGEADANRDGVVTVDELYQFAYRRTRWQTLSLPGGATQSPAYVANLKGQGAVALSFPRSSNALLQIHDPLAGSIAFTSREGIQIFRIEKVLGVTKSVQLPSSSYLVSVVDGLRVGEAEIEARSGKTVDLRITDVKWREQSRELSVQKGVIDQKIETVNSLPANVLNVPASTQYWYGIHSGYLKEQSALGPAIGVERAFAASELLVYGIHAHRNVGTREGIKFTTTSVASMLYFGMGIGPTFRELLSSDRMIDGVRLQLNTGIGVSGHMQAIDSGEAPEPRREFGILPQVTLKLSGDFYTLTRVAGTGIPSKNLRVIGIDLRSDFVPIDGTSYASGIGLGVRTTF